MCSLDIYNIGELLVLSLSKQYGFTHWPTVTVDNVSRTAFYYSGFIYLNKTVVDLFETPGISINQTILCRGFGCVAIWSNNDFSRPGLPLCAYEMWSTFDSFLCLSMLQCMPNTIHTFNKGLGRTTSTDLIILSNLWDPLKTLKKV